MVEESGDPRQQSLPGVETKEVDETRLIADGLERYEAEREGLLSEQPKFSLEETTEETKDLVAVHNIKQQELIQSLKLGGFPMPSIAITKADMGHDKFGEISVVFGKDTIDPQTNKGNDVYSQDAWTPSFPDQSYKISEDKAGK